MTLALYASSSSPIGTGWRKRRPCGVRSAPAAFSCMAPTTAAKSRAGVARFEIDAGLAFGTAHHASTRGCLLALDALFKRRRPSAVLDIGTGTGILAIAAAKVLALARGRDGRGCQGGRGRHRQCQEERRGALC